MADHEKVDRLIGIPELSRAGYGDRTTICQIIEDKRIPAVRVGKRIKLRASDLPLLAVPIHQRPAPVPEASHTPADQRLEQLLSRLTCDQRAAIYQLLASLAESIAAA